MPRKLLIGLLAFGTVAGFGSGFASVARRMHGGYGGGGCHSWRGQQNNGPGYGWNRGHGPNMNAGYAQQNVAPVAAAVAPPAPAVAAPAPAPVQQPSFIIVPQVAAPVQAVQAPVAAPAPSPAAQAAPIHINLTISPNGQVQSTPPAAQ